MSKRNRKNRAASAATEPAAPVVETQPEAAVETTEPTTDAPAASEPTGDAPTATATAKRNRRFTVGSAVDTTVFALNSESMPKGRPLTLAGALVEELAANGPGTVAELVDRLNASGQYEKVAIKSATLRPYSSVAYWLKTWRAAGHVVVVIPGAEVEAAAEVEVEAAVEAQ